MERKASEMKSFNRKIWVATAFVALFVIVILIFKATFNVLLLLLAGALIALYFHGLSALLQRKLQMPPTGSKLVSTLGSLALLILFFWFAGDRIQQQAEELSKTLPSAFNELKDQVNDDPFGKKVMDRISSAASEGKLSSAVGSFFLAPRGKMYNFQTTSVCGPQGPGAKMILTLATNSRQTLCRMQPLNQNS